MKPNIFVFDLETTGLPDSYDRIGILQIAGVVLDPNQPGLPQVAPAFNATLRPPDDAVWSPFALRMHKKHGRDHKFYNTEGLWPGHIFDRLAEWLAPFVVASDDPKKPYNLIPCGHNAAGFDLPILTKESRKYGVVLPLDYHVLDTCCMAYEKLVLKSDTPLKSASLKVVAPALGVPFDETKAHDALYDVLVTAEVLRKLLEV